MHVMGSDGTFAFDLCSTEPRWRTCGQGVAQPAWSPDGRWIAYAESAPRIGIGLSDSSIFIAAADGSHVRRITTGGNYDASPAWSDDGTEIRFVRYPCAGSSDCPSLALGLEVLPIIRGGWADEEERSDEENDQHYATAKVSSGMWVLDLGLVL